MLNILSSVGAHLNFASVYSQLVRSERFRELHQKIANDHEPSKTFIRKIVTAQLDAAFTKFKNDGQYEMVLKNEQLEKSTRAKIYISKFVMFYFEESDDDNTIQVPITIRQMIAEKTINMVNNIDPEKIETIENSNDVYGMMINEFTDKLYNELENRLESVDTNSINNSFDGICQMVNEVFEYKSDHLDDNSVEPPRKRRRTD